jgi:hypothetical protein
MQPIDQHTPHTPTTTDAIEVTCPCGAVHSFAPVYAGRIACCPQLQRRFQVPARSAAATLLETEPVVAPACGKRLPLRTQHRGAAALWLVFFLLVPALPLAWGVISFYLSTRSLLAPVAPTMIIPVHSSSGADLTTIIPPPQRGLDVRTATRFVFGACFILIGVGWLPRWRWAHRPAWLFYILAGATYLPKGHNAL